MYLRTIAFKNIKRRKGKMILVVAGLMVGITAFVSVVSIMLAFQNSISDELNAYGFNIMVYPKSSDLSLSYGGITISGVQSYKVKTLSDSDIKRIKSIDNANLIQVLSPKILHAVTVNRKQALLVGIDIRRELVIKKWWQIKGKPPVVNTNQLLLGSDASRKLGLKTGDSILIHGKKFEIAGILKTTGSQDDDLIFGSLSLFQNFLKRKGEINLIEISAKNTEDIDTIVDKVGKVLPNAEVSSVKQAVKYKEDAMGQLGKFGLAVTFVIIFISGLIVFTTMTSSVNDRTREIGVFRAIGYRQTKVAKIILIEAFILSLIGGGVGYFMGFGVAKLLPVIVKSIKVTAGFNVYLMVFSIMLSVIIGLISSSLPARRAANLDPTESLKNL
jgi:putative ABC transport system permease protein